MRRLSVLVRICLLSAAGLLLVCGCSDSRMTVGEAGPSSGPQASRPVLTEIAAAAGLSFEHDPGDERFWIVQEMGPGAALFDADGDGDLDAYLVQGGHIPGTEVGQKKPNRFFRNSGDGNFVDETEASGAGDTGYGLGCAAADYDADGDVDIYVSNVGRDTLLAGDGKGRFVDVTERAGLAADLGCSASAAFLDYDGDGRLDLFVTTYVAWRPELESACIDEDGTQDYCGPTNYPPGQDRLYRNKGDGIFEDVTVAAGLGNRPAYGLGVIPCDVNEDGRLDLYVANDSQPNFLWINQSDGTFDEQALQRGCATNGLGRPEGSMGLICEDLDADGDFDLLVTNFRNETNTLYECDGGFFTDVTSVSGLARFGVAETGFGVGLIDVENDGDPEIYIANGAVNLRRPPVVSDRPYAEHDLLLDIVAGGQVRDLGDCLDRRPEAAQMSRGAAFGDIDGDGDIDILVASNRGPARLLRNETPNAGHWLLIDARGKVEPEAVGAAITAAGAGRRWQRRVSPQGSYCSSSDRRVHFGVGSVTMVTITIRWPAGTVEQWPDLEVDRAHVLREGTGTPITNAAPCAGKEPGASTAAASTAAPRVPELAGEDERVLAALASQVVALMQGRQPGDALAPCEHWIAESRRRGGYEHPYLMQAFTAAARIHRLRGDVQAAERVLLGAIDEYTGAAGTSHLAVGRFASELGMLYASTGRLAEAEARLEQARGVTAEVFGKGSAQEMGALLQLGKFYDERSRLPEAQAAYEGALDAASRSAPDGPEVMTLARRLGSIAQSFGRWEEAARRYEQALPGHERSPDRVELANLMHDLCTVHGELLDHGRAVRFGERALALREELHGPRSIPAATTLSELGSAKAALGELDNGEKMVRQAIQVFTELESADSLYAATGLRNLGPILVQQKRFAEAEECFLSALATYQKSLGNDHAGTRQITENLAKLRRTMQWEQGR